MGCFKKNPQRTVFLTEKSRGWSAAQSSDRTFVIRFYTANGDEFLFFTPKPRKTRKARKENKNQFFCVFRTFRGSIKKNILSPFSVYLIELRNPFPADSEIALRSIPGL